MQYKDIEMKWSTKQWAYHKNYHCINTIGSVIVIALKSNKKSPDLA